MSSRRTSTPLDDSCFVAGTEEIDLDQSMELDSQVGLSQVDGWKGLLAIEFFINNIRSFAGRGLIAGRTIENPYVQQRPASCCTGDAESQDCHASTSKKNRFFRFFPIIEKTDLIP